MKRATEENIYGNLPAEGRDLVLWDANGNLTAAGRIVLEVETEEEAAHLFITELGAAMDRAESKRVAADAAEAYRLGFKRAVLSAYRKELRAGGKPNAAKYVKVDLGDDGETISVCIRGRKVKTQELFSGPVSELRFEREGQPVTSFPKLSETKP